MRFATILSVAAFAGLSVAQNADGPGKGCAGQNVLVSCLGTQASRIASCKSLDYACMCQIQADVLQCYDQCPNDINRSTEESKLTAYCVAASAAVTTPAPTATSATFSVESSTATDADAAEATESATETEDEDESPSSTETSEGSATSTDDADSAAARITWMCASSLLAVLTAAFMAL